MAGSDWQSQFPFQSHYLDLGGYRMHYVDEGSGLPVLFVHGNPTWSFFWREPVRAFRQSYRALAVDHIGCGLSDKPSEAVYSYRLAQRIADLKVFIERLDLNEITLVCHDWGGAIGLGAAVDMPERFSRLVLSNTAAFPDDRCPWRIHLARTPGLGRLAVQGLNAFARAALSMAVADRRSLSSAARAGLLAPYRSWASRRAIYRFVKDVPLSPRHPSYNTLVSVASGLGGLRHLPVCLIWGVRDWCFPPRFAERFLTVFPQAELHQLDVGHYVVEEASSEYVKLMEIFLASTLDARGGGEADNDGVGANGPRQDA